MGGDREDDERDEPATMRELAVRADSLSRVREHLPAEHELRNRRSKLLGRGRVGTEKGDESVSASCSRMVTSEHETYSETPDQGERSKTKLKKNPDAVVYRLAPQTCPLGNCPAFDAMRSAFETARRSL